VKDALLKAGFGFSLNPGDVVTVKDKEVRFPLNLIRKPHERRFALVLMNNVLCEKSQIILVAPMTSNLEVKSMAHMEYVATKENGLEVKSRLLLDQIQPIPKAAIITPVGRLSVSDWDMTMTKLFWIFDRA
jgi:mRNA-degrading endonuclease toxin of MazEF toxin-antitoxin module